MIKEFKIHIPDKDIEQLHQKIDLTRWPDEINDYKWTLGTKKSFLENESISTKTLSIDTYKPAVARFALENGFNMINDIKSGGDDNMMMQLAAEYNCPIVLMHMKGTPATMQNKPFYIDILGEIQDKDIP